MRVYTKFGEALGEIKRDLAEMGMRIHTKTYQDKDISGNENFSTLELQNYIYTVTNPDLNDLSPTVPWVYDEWGEREAGIMGNPVNPGEAYKLREDLWKEFLESDGQFSYSYSERFSRHVQVARVIQRIKADADSRQLFISVWGDEDIMDIGGAHRVPCTLGYLVQVRNGRLNLTYLQRSADFVTHFTNDIWLAHRLQVFIANHTNYLPGFYTHWIGSLHVYHKDVKDVF